MKTAYRTLLVALACGLGVWFNAFGETSELPDGYAKREYIQTTGQQYLTPGYIPNENTKYVLDIKFSGTFKALGTNGGIFTTPATGDYGFSINFGGNDNQNKELFCWPWKTYDAGGGSVVANKTLSSASVLTTRNTLSFGQGNFSYGSSDSLTIHANATAEECVHENATIFLGTASEPFTSYIATLYGIKIYEGGHAGPRLCSLRTGFERTRRRL